MAIEKILNKRSNEVVFVKEKGDIPKSPTLSQLDYGEIAVNYHKGMEKLFIKNDNEEVVGLDWDKKYVDVLDAEVLLEKGESYSNWSSQHDFMTEMNADGEIYDLSDNPVTIDGMTFNHSIRLRNYGGNGIKFKFNINGKVKIWLHIYTYNGSIVPYFYIGDNRVNLHGTIHYGVYNVKSGDILDLHGYYDIYEYYNFELFRIEFIADFENNVLPNIIELNDFSENFSENVYTKTQVDNLIPTKLSDLSEDTGHRTITDEEQADYNHASEEFKDYTNIDYNDTIKQWNNTSVTITHDGKFIFENYKISNTASIGGGTIRAILTRGGEETTIIEQTISPRTTITLNNSFNVYSGDVISFTNGLTAYDFGVTNKVYLKYFTYKTLPSKTSDLTNDSGFLTEHQSLKTINNNSLVGEGNLNVGTITGITMNGNSMGTNGVVNLGTVITSHQDISGKVDKVEGKGLSTNDYTDGDKNIVNGLSNLPTTKFMSIGNSIIMLSNSGEVSWGNKINNITLNPNTIEIRMGNTSSISAQVSGSTPIASSLTWTSSNPNVVSITENDTSVTAFGENYGNATITCTDTYSDLFGTASITVLPNINASDFKYWGDYDGGLTDLVYDASDDEVYAQATIHYDLFPIYTSGEMFGRQPYLILFVKENEYTQAEIEQFLKANIQINLKQGTQWFTTDTFEPQEEDLHIMQDDLTLTGLSLEKDDHSMKDGYEQYSIDIPLYFICKGIAGDYLEWSVDIMCGSRKIAYGLNAQFTAYGGSEPTLNHNMYFAPSHLTSPSQSPENDAVYIADVRQIYDTETFKVSANIHSENEFKPVIFCDYIPDNVSSNNTLTGSIIAVDCVNILQVANLDIDMSDPEAEIPICLIADENQNSDVKDSQGNSYSPKQWEIYYGTPDAPDNLWNVQRVDPNQNALISLYLTSPLGPAININLEVNII